MDPFTHVLLGGAVAQAAAPRGDARKAAFTGGLAAIIPDLDIFIPTGGNSLSALLLHRNFSHSIAFMPLGALMAAGIVWLLLRRSRGFGRIYGWALLGIVVHAPLDALNAYGTTLLWPFSDVRVAWPIMPVVEVVFTTTLLIAVAVALWYNRPRAARMGLVLVCLWLGLAVVQYERARGAIETLASARGDTIERMLVQPTLGNLWLWGSRYETPDGHYQLDAVHLGLPGSARVYPGDRPPTLRLDQAAGIAPDSRVARDIARFRWFADDWLIRDPQSPQVIGDARYLSPPHRARPLWGVRYDADDHGRPVEFRHFHSVVDQDWAAFVLMIAGRAVDMDDTGATLWRPQQPEPIDE